MIFPQLSPNWFLGYNVALELIFAIVALIIGAFAFKIYKKTNQQQIKLFGISFAFISASYIVQAIFNTMAIIEANEHTNLLIELSSIVWFQMMGVYTNIILTIIGLCTLAYMTFKTNKTRILYLMIIISLLGIFLSANILYMFFLFSTIYLLVILVHFIKNYLENKQKNSLLIAIAFIFLLIGSIHFMISVNHQLFYAIGHILELIAYMLILTNFYLVLRK